MLRTLFLCLILVALVTWAYISPNKFEEISGKAETGIHNMLDAARGAVRSEPATTSPSEASASAPALSPPTGDHAEPPAQGGAAQQPDMPTPPSAATQTGTHAEQSSTGAVEHPAVTGADSDSASAPAKPTQSRQSDASIEDKLRDAARLLSETDRALGR